MIKNKQLTADDIGQVEVYDMEGLRDIIRLAKIYVARENGFDTDGERGVPGSNYCDFDLDLWGQLTELIRYGQNLEKKRREREAFELRQDYIKRRDEEFKKNFSNRWDAV